jgi:tetratricopeptide (TPR) repeat protein
MVLLALLSCLASIAPCPAASPADYEQQWKNSDRDLKVKETPEVYHARLALIASPLFDGLSDELRHMRLLSTGSLGVEVRDYAGAHRLLMRSSGMPGQLADDWAWRLFAAYGMDDMEDATLALGHIARSWPGDVWRISPRMVLRIAFREPQSDQQRTSRFELRLSLYHAAFKGEHGVPPGALWAALATDLLERGREAQALEIIPSIDSPREILAMRIDRRFDALARQAPRLFDVKAAAERQIRDHEQAVQRFPRDIDAVVQLCAAYLDSGRYREALRAADAVLSHGDDPKGFATLYDEDETALNWLLDAYARADVAAGRFDGAVSALELAAQGLEHGRLNISNVINLGALYGDLGRADKALRVLAEISEADSETLMSAYGRMQWHGARQVAALIKGNTVLADTELGYLRAHQEDAIDAYQEGLLRAGRLDEAAQLLIARLRDPQRYLAALREIQVYDHAPALPGLVQLRTRRSEVVRRPDVQTAIAQVGRIEKFPIPPEGGF